MTSGAPLEIRLLGAPQILRDGVPVPAPRGRKAWAVLAYLALAERPVARARLAELVFGGADDPLGALRWTLAQLRRALGVPEALAGDPLALDAPGRRGRRRPRADRPPTRSGARARRAARGHRARRRARSSRPGCSWSAAGSPARARRCCATPRTRRWPPAGRSTARRSPRARSALDPFDENAHELLVRCLAAAGDRSPPRAHADACEALFRRRARPGAGPAVAPRRGRPSGADGPPAVGDRGRGRRPARGRAGRARRRRGGARGRVPAPGVRRGARASATPRCWPRVLAALGVALVHSVRGRDEEGAAVLHEALALAEEHERARRRRQGLPRARLRRGAGRPRRVGRPLADAGLRARARSTRSAPRCSPSAAWRSRTARTTRPRSGCSSRRSRSRAAAATSAARPGRSPSSAGPPPPRRARGGRGGARGLARARARDGLDRVPAVPGVAPRRGRAAPRRHRARLRAARARVAARLPPRRPVLGGDGGPQLGARARGRGRARRRRSPGCARPRSRAVRVADPYVWIHAYCLDALARVEIDAGAPEAPATVARLERLAARADMREFVVRARAAPRGRLGDARRRWRPRGCSPRRSRTPRCTRSSRSRPDRSHTRAHTAG